MRRNDIPSYNSFYRRYILKKYFAILFLIFVVVGCKKAGSSSTQNPPPPSVNRLWKFENVTTWEEDFNNTGNPDGTKWTLETGGHGWGNNELQYYTNSNNAVVDNGTLKIIAKKEMHSGKEYTSARLITKGKGEWLYGRIEVKAKLPKGKGTWPAIWMLPADNIYGGWPGSGEIDIMEHVGFDQNRVHFTIHTKAFNHLSGTQKGANKIISDATDAFHIYRLDWASYGIRGYIDNEIVYEFPNQGGSDYWPFDKKFFLILNIAIGGNWGGQQGIDNSIFPALLEIDYIRVFKFLE